MYIMLLNDLHKFDCTCLSQFGLRRLLPSKDSGESDETAAQTRWCGNQAEIQTFPIAIILPAGAKPAWRNIY